MLYQLTQGPTEKLIIQQSVQANVPLPDKIKNAPELRDELAFYMIAFNDLTTCRAIGMAEGPIPWVAIKEYAGQYDLDDEELESLVYHIQAMDGVYLGHRAKQMKHK